VAYQGWRSKNCEEIVTQNLKVKAQEADALKSEKRRIKEEH